MAQAWSASLSGVKGIGDQLGIPDEVLSSCRYIEVEMNVGEPMVMKMEIVLFNGRWPLPPAPVLAVPKKKGTLRKKRNPIGRG